MARYAFTHDAETATLWVDDGQAGLLADIEISRSNPLLCSIRIERIKNGLRAENRGSLITAPRNELALHVEKSTGRRVTFSAASADGKWGFYDSVFVTLMSDEEEAAFELMCEQFNEWVKS